MKVGEDGKPIERRLEVGVSPGRSWSLIKDDLSYSAEPIQAPVFAEPGRRPSVHRAGSVGVEEVLHREGVRGPRLWVKTTSNSLDSHEPDQDPVHHDEPELQRPMTSQGHSFSKSRTLPQDRTMPMPTRPQTSAEANRVLVDEDMESMALALGPLVPQPNHPLAMPINEWDTPSIHWPQDRQNLADTSTALSSTIDVSTSFMGGDHSQSLEWQTTSRESPTSLAPWGSWTDGRGKPSYVRAGGWLVSLKQAQMVAGKVQASSPVNLMPRSSAARPAASNRPNHPKHGSSLDRYQTGYHSISPSAQLWQASIDHLTFEASQGTSQVNMDHFFDCSMKAEYSLNDEESCQFQVEPVANRRGRRKNGRQNASRSRSQGSASSSSRSQSQSRSRSESRHHARSPAGPRSPSVERHRGVLGAVLEPRAHVWTPQKGFCREDVAMLSEDTQKRGRGPAEGYWSEPVPSRGLEGGHPLHSTL